MAAAAPPPPAQQYFTSNLHNALAMMANVPGLDPRDVVMQGHLELFDYDCLALPAMTCGESALRLAMAVVWSDTNLKKKRADRDPIPVLLTHVNGPLSILEMVRRLNRTGIASFPIYRYEGLDFNGQPQFALTSGKARADNHALVFVPALGPPAAFVTAHWTFTTVLPPPAVPERRAAGPPVILYTRLPMAPQDDPVVGQISFWRARVCPENAEAFAAAAAQGMACKCPWIQVCDHETAWLAQHPGTLRITCADSVCMEGSSYAMVVKAFGTDTVLRRIPNNGVKVLQYNTELREENVFGCPTIRSERFFNAMAVAFGSLELQPYSQVLELDLYPFRFKSYTYGRPVEHSTLFNMFKGLCLDTASVLTPYTFQREFDVEPVSALKPWGEVGDLTIQLPRMNELLQRLAVRKEVTADVVIDTVRRLAHEEKWTTDIDRDEFELWLSRVVTDKGEKPQPASPLLVNGQCWDCMRVVKTYRHQCKLCKAKARNLVPERPLSDAFATHVGFFPLWSEHFTLPYMQFKRGTWVMTSKNGRKMTTRSEVDKWLRRQEIVTTQRGKLCGPMFANQVPKCFPKGQAVALSAFLVRLGGVRPYPDSVPCANCLTLGLNECAKTAACPDSLVFSESLRPDMQRAYTLLFEAFSAYVNTAGLTQALCPLSPESHEEFMSHFTGAKRVKMEEALMGINEGWLTVLESGHVDVKFTGFTKAEKSYDIVWEMDHLGVKGEQKPRFICSPNPLVLYVLGRYTHAQTKWLAKRFPWDSRMFYAGCATPEEMHSWLNYTAPDAQYMNTIVDDVSAMDSSFTKTLLDFHERIRDLQFPHLTEFIRQCFRGEECFTVRIGEIKAHVEWINASGVSDTSYKNSAPCLPLRVFAIVHAVWSILEGPISLVMARYHLVASMIYTSAAGDDGLTRVPQCIEGVNTSSSLFKKRYSEAWSYFGFNVKVAIVPPNRWRMATYLAQRPVWVGHRYEWAPEPARRLRGIFWQIDCPLHPIAWGRGIATQLLQQAKAVPVVSHICSWYLERTQGPAIISAATAPNHEYSPFYGSICTGDINDRGVSEFCVDYNIPREELERFVRLLELVPSVLVNLNSFVLDRIFSEES